MADKVEKKPEPQTEPAYVNAGPPPQMGPPRNTVRIDGADYDVETLPNVAKIAIEHLVAIDKEVQRAEMARAGFAQAIKAVMEGDEAPAPVEGSPIPNSKRPPADKVAREVKGADLKIVPDPSEQRDPVAPV
jgi:hypothetical protein|tara:strand:+ start:2525 stop:2920 length:396 start_codon:yes stop_codon:yes gene_type:complete